MLQVGRRRPMSFYRGGTGDYTPNTIGKWIAVENRDMPWNTIGEALRGSKGEGSTVDHLMTADEALDATGLDMFIKKVQVKDPDTGNLIPRMYATCYDDADHGRQYFGAVTDKYQVVQPRENLRMFDEIIRSKAGANYSAVWQMREKSMMGVTIEFPETIVVDPNGAADEMGLYGLGINSFDGSTGLVFSATATRFWCMNQLPPSFKGVPRSVSFKHTSGVSARVADAQRAMGVTMTWAAELDRVANELYATRMTARQLENVMKKFDQFALDGSESDLQKARVIERRDDVVAAWNAPHNAGITGTRWGAFNVLGEYADWGRTVHGSSRTGTDATRQRAIGTLVNWPTSFKTRVLEALTTN